MMPSPAFWAGRRVLLTGHTGFKGSWAALWLEDLGADVAGYALAPDQTPSLFEVLGGGNEQSTVADLADETTLRACVRDFRPEVILHLAAQPLVRRSYREPSATFATNVQGTVNLLDAARELEELSAVLVVTTDKVYANTGTGRRFVEDDRLGGHDPYSASKACCELVTACYRSTYFAPRGVGLATARAGNVVGGGDWSEDRLVPDIWRAISAGRVPELRYPRATRPWQHVLESIAGYLLYVEALTARPDDSPAALNFGPSPDMPDVTVAEVAETFAGAAGAASAWAQADGDHPHEMATLALDPSLAIATLGWTPRLDPATALQWTADWYRSFEGGADPRELTLDQIARYRQLAAA